MVLNKGLEYPLLRKTYLTEKIGPITCSDGFAFYKTVFKIKSMLLFYRE